jgi:hypothetical protein
MINGTGKQAIKNTAAPVTNLLRGPAIFAAEAGHCARNSRDPAKNRGAGGYREGNSLSGAAMGRGGNETLTLSRHNRSQRGVPRALSCLSALEASEPSGGV